MATFFMFGKYTGGALENASAQRTEQAKQTIQKHGGQLKNAYALLGEHDLALIVDLPDVEAAMKTSIALNKLTGIAFSTAPAVDVAAFDKLVREA